MSSANWCTNNGSLSPLNPNGSKNKENIEYWKTFGDQDPIRAAMNNMFNEARNQENSKNKTGLYLTKCFGKAYSDKMVAKWLKEEADERARILAEEKRKAEEQRKAEERRREEERRNTRK
jgi:hypothetical protein